MWFVSLQAACAAPLAVPPNFLPAAVVHIRGVEIQAEVANTPATRQTGLMHRRSLEKNHGMLFVFEGPHIQCMWMKNTLIDLDVAFIDESLNIVNIETMRAGTTQIHCSTQPVALALEMNAGWFARNGAGPGTRVDWAMAK